jgi:hypothetical protein
MRIYRPDRSYWKSVLGVLEILIMVKLIAVLFKNDLILDIFLYRYVFAVV